MRAGQSLPTDASELIPVAPVRALLGQSAGVQEDRWHNRFAIEPGTETNPLSPTEDNGGWHLLFRFDPRVTNSKDKLGNGIDVKASGGYIVGAPSWIAPSKSGKGGRYIWEVSPFDVPVPKPPAWMTATLASPPRQNATLVRQPRERRHRVVGALCCSSPHGERNSRLHWAACRVGELVAKHKVSAASSIARPDACGGSACGLIGPEVLRTIQSGFKAGEGHG